MTKLSTYKQIFKNYKQLYKNNPEFAIFYSKCINIMTQIIQDTSKIRAKEYLKTKKHITGAKAISYLYEIKILHNFIAHQTLLKNGIIVASYNHLRTIYETIIKIYLNIVEPELGELNFKYETRKGNENISKDGVQEIENVYRKNHYLNPGFIEQKLYDTKSIKSTRKFYREISNLVHPSIISMAACYEVKPEAFIDNCKLGIGLTSCNFIILFELYGNKIKKKYRKKLLELIKEYPKFIPEGTPVLIPSVKRDNLNIKSYNHLIEILQKV